MDAPLIAPSQSRKARPTAKRARELFNYDPDTGILSKTIMVGAKHNGYLMVSIDGKQYSSHRVAWLIMTGEWPREQVDHVNMNTVDNRWANLREATMAQNQANVPRRRSNRSGLKGVSWHKRVSKWVSYLQVSGKNYNLGTFDCPAAAHFAYVVAAEKAFGEFARVA